MRVKGKPSDILAEAKGTLAACWQIDPAMRVGAVSQEEFAQKIAQAETIQSEIQTMELKLADMRNKRDDQVAHVWDITKRARSGVKSTYGDDSHEYELVGGTRLSDRKRPARKQPEQPQ